MRADDVAAKGHGRRSVAEALFALSDVASPSAVLAATGVHTAQRVERLLATIDAGKPSKIGSAARASGGVLAFGLLAAALAIAGDAAICLV